MCLSPMRIRRNTLIEKSNISFLLTGNPYSRLKMNACILKKSPFTATVAKLCFDICKKNYKRGIDNYAQ